MPQNPLTHVHALLSLQTLVVVLGSLNRLGPWTTGYVAPNQFLRWVDFINMLPLPIISVVAFYLLKKHLERNALSPAPSLVLNLVFLVGVYVMAASYGDHEVTNYLHTFFSGNDRGHPSPITSAVRRAL